VTIPRDDAHRACSPAIRGGERERTRAEGWREWEVLWEREREASVSDVGAATRDQHDRKPPDVDEVIEGAIGLTVGLPAVCIAATAEI
jgi:hypothetical protein